MSRFSGSFAELSASAEIPEDIPPVWPDGHLLADGRYRILDGETLGEGAMGRVYRAMDGVFNRVVAIKEFIGYESENAGQLRQRFLNEATLAARLQHPNIITVLDAGQDGDRLWYAMEMLDSACSLADLLDEADEKNKDIPLSDLYTFFRQTVRGLCAMGAIGLWHRDLKPANILLARLLDGRWVVKLIDFGIAHDPKAKLTDLGVYPGTPAYMAPENFPNLTQWPPHIEVDKRIDYYSLGVTFYEAFTRQHPYADIVEQNNPRRFAAEMFRSPDTYPVPASHLRPDMTPGIESIIHKCMERNPNDRYADAADILADLEVHSSLPGYQPPSRAELVARHAAAAATPLPASGASLRLPDMPLVRPVVASGGPVIPGVVEAKPRRRWPWVAVPIAAALAGGAVFGFAKSRTADESAPAAVQQVPESVVPPLLENSFVEVATPPVESGSRSEVLPKAEKPEGQQQARKRLKKSPPRGVASRPAQEPKAASARETLPAYLFAGPQFVGSEKDGPQEKKKELQGPSKVSSSDR